MLPPSPSKARMPRLKRVFGAAPTPLKGKDATSEQCVEAKAQPSMATRATEDDTCPKVLICGEWRKVPDGYPKDASRQLERDEQFHQ